MCKKAINFLKVSTKAFKKVMKHCSLRAFLVGVVTNRENKKCVPPSSRGKTNTQQKGKFMNKSS